MSAVPAQGELHTILQNLYTLMKLLMHRCTVPAVTKIASLPVSTINHSLCLSARTCVCARAYVCLCAHKCTDILCLEDYARMEQEQLKREMKGDKRSYSFDIFKHPRLWQKPKTNKRNSQSYTPKPSEFFQRANKDFYFYFFTDTCMFMSLLLVFKDKG